MYCISASGGTDGSVLGGGAGEGLETGGIMPGAGAGAAGDGVAGFWVLGAGMGGVTLDEETLPGAGALEHATDAAREMTARTRRNLFMA